MSKAIMIVGLLAVAFCFCCCVLGGGLYAFSGPSPAPAPAPTAQKSPGELIEGDGVEDEPEGANVAEATNCSRQVTATRTDTGNPAHGWGMNLRFKCGDTLVPIGSSGGGPKSHTVKFDGTGCPSEINKSNWEGNDTYPDTFEISVGECNISELN